MDLWLLFYIGVGVVIPIIGKLYYHNEFTWQEWLLVVVVNTIIVSFVHFGGMYRATMDVEIHNGHVHSKQNKKVSCEHSYECNCVNVSCGKDCTTRVCQTCYRHSYDVNWVVYTTVGDINIKRIDEQGLKEPPRYSQVIIGESVSLEKLFVNYIKATPESLFNLSHLDKSDIEVPKYPKVFDYYRINRVLNPDNIDVDVDGLNYKLNKSLESLGPEKHSNVVVVLTSQSEEYASVLKGRWLGGKQNDTIVVIGLDGNKIKWTDTFGFSKSEMSNQVIKNDLKSLGQYDISAIDLTITSAIQNYFERRSMEDYAYLEDQIEPPLWSIILGLLFSIIGTTIATIYLSKNNTRAYGAHKWRH